LKEYKVEGVNIGNNSIEQQTLKKTSVELKLKQLQLNALLQITEAINQNFTKNQLLSIYEFVLRNQLKIRSLLLWVNDGGTWTPALRFGFVNDENLMNVTKALQSGETIESSIAKFEGLSANFQDIIPVFHKDKPLAYACIGNSKDDFNSIDYREAFSPFVRTVTNIVVVALENKRLAKDSIKQAGIKKELALAAEMQGMLFPKKLPNLDNIEMSAVYLPHQEIGGDYYDFIRISEHEYITVMADVSGKGIAAALLMSNFQATLHALKKHFTNLKDLVQQLNKSVIRSANGEKFITLFICKFNNKTLEFEYINAGHNPPMLYLNKQVHLLEEGTTGLGMFDDLPFINMGRFVARRGFDYVLACYTDGVVELENDHGNHFGMERLQKLLIEHSRNMGVHQLQNELIDQLNSFKGKQNFVDDIAILLCKCKF